ncbi:MULTISPECIES: YihY/virulence factor BrkB family protein [Chryseobacterium]|uniref:Membrane protein n=1 Tax=Chryseobacterium camelliae TaxID=1265445 RepID=A0ABU0TI12_9FLAO|nr:MULTISPECIES: YihY/virulence factor BrkB family protein [Chryseobacterium]MDT3409438.1 membrane protein [Pseudacidovorax intermedius]MDQ1096697.1 membrane protein [Chryseobacterium camelliae]MDQ1100641.1 membrane protein [Chryseobacterium sp. SORGH_AS_1048]MDR6087979.1 membrane protein [Chryseobacterium sp. SORGH_AS_0909]MDR6132354.1 membrane protein [Chryseobacterium sp. SORGH_AS_1175]
MKITNNFWNILKDTFKDWSARDLGTEAASLAYSAIFSIPGLLIIIIWFAGIFFGEEAVRGEITKLIGSMMGKDVGKSLEEMVIGGMVDKKNIVMKIVGVVTLVFGATSLFFQFQKSLNKLWDVVAAPKKAWEKYLLDRANSLGMIVVIAFLLLITLLLSSFIGLANDWIIRRFNLETLFLVNILNIVVGFAVTLILFAAMFKILPDVEIQWKSVWVGAAVTAALFTLGKYLLTFYFDTFNPSSAFGTAGTIILLLLWINYTCQIIFFGAEFTKVYAKTMGHELKPSRHAKWSPQMVSKEDEKDMVEGAEPAQKQS